MSSILVIGAQNIDIFAKTNDDYELRDSNIASITLAYGGVGRNIAENLKRIGNDVSFMTVFGDDTFSTQARDSLIKMNIEVDHSITVQESSNSIYLGILDKDNDLYLGLNDMAIAKSLNVSYFETQLDYINTFKHVVIDNNLSSEAITYLLKNITIPVFMDAVSAKKVIKLKGLLQYINVLKVNTIELKELSDKDSITDQIADVMSKGITNLLVTDGENEITLSNKETYKSMPIYIEKIVNASGAGDAFLSGFVHGMINSVKDAEKVEYAKLLAYHTLLCNEATSKSINKDVLK